MMSYKVPDEDTISNAIENVLNRANHIDTQKEFSDRVRKELILKNRDYRVSSERIRRIGVDRGLVKLTIEYRESDIKGLPHTCPVCRNAMSPIMNRSLDGDSVEVKRRCTVCPYAIGKKVMTPGRYIFSRAPNTEISPEELTIRKLNRSKAKIKEAIDIIKDALRNTEFDNRVSELITDLNEIMDSDELSYSIKNISADIKYNNEEQPVWTSPLRSVKHVDRKDI